MRLFAVVLAFAFGVLATHVGTAYADDPALAEARRLESTLEYEPALQIVEGLIAAGGATRDQLVERHLLAGRLAAGLDRPDAAKAHFARVLALAPATTLPVGTSPKLTEPLEAARTIAPPLRISARDGVVVDLLVLSDPLEIIEGIVVRLADGSELRAPHARSIAIPRGTFAIEVIALDDHGNTVWSGPAERVEGPHSGPPRPLPTPLYKRWRVWAGVGVFAATIGGLAAWRFSVAQDDWNDLEAAGMTDFTQLRDVEARGRRWGLAANVSFGVAAAAGIAAAICLVARTDEPRFAIVPSSSSPAFALLGSF